MRGTLGEAYFRTEAGHLFVKQLFRMADRVADKVADRLYVTDIEGVQQLSENNTLGITAILNVSEYESYPVFVADYLHLSPVDGESVSADLFWEAMKFCKRVYGQGKTLLIHCAYGSSRSVNLLEAFMVLQNLATDMNEAHRKELLARPESIHWAPSSVVRTSVIRHLEEKRQWD